MKRISLLLIAFAIIFLLNINCGKAPDQEQLESSPEITDIPKESETVEPAVPQYLSGINFEEFIPDNVYLYFSFDNIKKSSDIFEKSAFGKLWNDPEIKQFTEKAIEMAKKGFTKNVTHETNITFNDITSLFEVFNGQVAFVLDSIELKNIRKTTKREVRDTNGQIVWNQDTGELEYEEVEVEDIEPMPHLILMAEVTGNKEKLEDLLEKICTSLTEEDVLKKKEDYKGISYFTFYKKKESTKLSYGYMDNIFFVSYGEKALRRFVDSYKKSTATKALSTKLAYQKITAQNKEDRLSTFYISIPPFVSMIKAFSIKEQLSNRTYTPEELDNINKTFDKVLDLSGLADLKSIIGITKSEGNGLVSEGIINIPGSKRGIWAVLANEATSEFKTLKAAPADSFIYMASTVSLSKLYDEIMNIIANVMPREQFENIVQAQLKSAEENLGLKIRDDILSVFGSEIAFSMDTKNKAPTLNTISAFIPFKMSFVIPIIKPDKMKQVYDQIMKIATEESQGQLPFVEKPYDGFTFHIMETPGLGEEEKMQIPEDQREIMGFFFTNDMFVYAIPASNLKKIADALSGKNIGSLMNNKDFTELLSPGCILVPISL